MAFTTRLVASPFAMVNNLDEEIERFKEFVARTKKSLKTVEEYRLYAKYLTLLADPIRFAVFIMNASEGVKRHVLKVASAFCKYLDLKFDTDTFSRYFANLRKKLGLKWTKGEARKSLVELVEDRISIYLRIIESVEKPKYKLFYRFMLETGLRTSEAIEAFNSFTRYYRQIDAIHILELQKVRKTKRVYFAFITPSLAKEMTSKPSTWTVSARRIHMHWKKACEKLSLDHRKYNLYGLRKVHATILRRAMDRELVDLLQGRAPRTIFDRYYNIESLKHLYKLYLQAMSILGNVG